MTEFSRKVQHACWALYFIALVASYPWLPDSVGDPGKQIAKGAYIALMLLTTLPLPWVLGGGILKWVRKDTSLLNIPNKGYWLAPERAQESWARLDAFCLRLGWLTWCLFAALHFRAVAEAPGGLPAIPKAGFDIAVLVLVLTALLGALQFVLAWRVPKATLAAFQAQQEAPPTEGINDRAIKRPPRPSHTPRSTHEPNHGQPR
jgi:hypothetical protein